MPIGPGLVHTRPACKDESGQCCLGTWQAGVAHADSTLFYPHMQPAQPCCSLLPHRTRYVLQSPHGTHIWRSSP